MKEKNTGLEFGDKKTKIDRKTAIQLPTINNIFSMKSLLVCFLSISPLPFKLIH